MLCLLISFLSFFLIFKSFPLKPLPCWASEVRLISVSLAARSLRDLRLIGSLFNCNSSAMSAKKCLSRMGRYEEPAEMSVLELPDLALEIILGKLCPSGLCNMAGVCTSLRDWCRSDHLWERHMSEKWSRVIGPAARQEWQWHLALRKDSSSVGAIANSKPKRWIASLARVWPLSWIKSRLDGGCKPRSPLPDDSIMSWYLSLESGKFSFPAQVYNREHGHVGFMLSCYDADICYDRHTDTFKASYPPHGRRPKVTEEGVQWDRIRAAPVDTPAHDLHVSDCLNDLRPGDHIEIQWRRNKEFPYGWWYGIVGHFETCDGNEHFCRCSSCDTVMLEFNQYTPGSRWRRANINRKDHREVGNETDGFYGGIRKLHRKDEISMWRRLWPNDILE